MTAIRITVVEALGSTPRDAGAWMTVSAEGIRGSIGGGALEHRAIEAAQAMLAEGRAEARLDLPLGPALSQCCGGYVVLALEAVEAEAPGRSAQGRDPLCLYGAGHVGRAMVKALEDLPFEITWIDPRPAPFPDGAAAHARLVEGDPLAVAAAAAPGSFHLVVTHDHGLDRALCAVLLRRDDLAYVGLIGSRTKKERFRRQLRAEGLADASFARLVCPIGVAGIRGKEPAVIAAAAVAELLIVRSRRLASRQGTPHAASA